MGRELLDVVEHAPHPLMRRVGHVERDAVRNRVEVGDAGLGPDYFSHRDMRALAWRCERMRPILDRLLAARNAFEQTHALLLLFERLDVGQ